MKEVDLVLLTEARYINPTEDNSNVRNILYEDKLLKEALKSKGLNVIRADWATKDFDWSSAKAAMFRTTWDYFDKHNVFIEWLHQTNSLLRFINPIALVIWNLDKHYLQDLSKKGVNIPTTIFIEQGDKTTLDDLMAKSGWTDAILKPAVSGGARHTYRLNENNLIDYENLFQKIIAKEAVLLQPFQKSILERGEVALMFINGIFSHAILKVAKEGDFRVQDDFGGTVHHYIPTSEELKLGLTALNACKQLPLYARVDLIIDNQGSPAVIELELIEPEMWFRFNPKSASRLADALSQYLSTF
jgi:glutathione synthase/RimK-type ligase-like ATP-grasp enzyme